ncbi:MAG: D-glycero-alpha-D-manno-heptose-1,7-bisphosphate 7-phosphatase [Gemmatimonadales bacterium]
MSDPEGPDAPDAPDAPAAPAAPAAVFIDRDNTIVEDPGYLHEPALVKLKQHAARGLARITAAGWPIVVVSNQSGIARGVFGEDAYHAVMSRIRKLLAPSGAELMADYFCPHLSEITGPCECRKPGTLLFRRAATDHGFDLARSWYLGDRWRDVAPALELGGRGLLIGAAEGQEDARQADAHGILKAADLLAAARIVGRPHGVTPIT